MVPRFALLAFCLLIVAAGCATKVKRFEFDNATVAHKTHATKSEVEKAAYRPSSNEKTDGPIRLTGLSNDGRGDSDEAQTPGLNANPEFVAPLPQDSFETIENDRQGGEFEQIAKPNQPTLQLDDVLVSVADCYPLLEIAIAELAEAEGKTLSAWGSFDTTLSGYTHNQPLGFHENYQHGGKLSRPLWNGSEVYGGFRLGRGVFEPWYQERQTNEGGEFKTGVKRPFLKGLAIDGRRAALQTARLERQRLEPDIATRVIGMQRAASLAYWKWVASGLATQTQMRLLRLAQERNKSLIKRVEEGDLPEITKVDNGRFIAKRQVKLIETQRKVQEAAIKLSLFMRDENCRPVVAIDEMLPSRFPTATVPSAEEVESDIVQALSQRPELLDLDFQRRQVEVELRYARNLTLPKLDGFAEASQDMGEPTSSKRDKSELELEVGLIAEVPLQRRMAIGKIRAARAKLAQIAAKRGFAEDKIRSQVLDAVSALTNAYERIDQARKNLMLSEQSLRLGRLRFNDGDIDIIDLNIYETSLAEAELLVIDAELTYFNALADYRAALAIEFNPSDE